MIINYFFLAFVTIINFVYYLSPADMNSPIIITINYLGAGMRTGMSMKSIAIVGVTCLKPHPLLGKIICAPAQHSPYQI